MQLLELHFFAAVALDVFDGIADNGEVAQAQKVHLQQANGLAGGVIPAGDIGAIGRPLPHRDVVHQPHGGHNHRTGVHASLANNTLQAARGVINLFHIRVSFHHLADLGGLGIALVVGVSNAPQRNVLRHNRRRQRAVDTVGHLEAGLAKVYLGGVLNGLLGFHRTEGNDLGNLILAPALGGVGNHLAAAAIVEVDIDIGRGRALGVQKALEEQVVFQRINIGNGQRVGHERTRRRTTAGPHADAHRTRILNKLRHDEEVGRVALHLNHGNLVLGALDILLRHIAPGEPPLQPLHHLVGQPGGGGVALGDIGNGHAVVGVFLPDLAVVLHALGNPQSVIAAIRNQVIPGIAHLRGGLDVVAGTAELEAVRVHERLAGLHAQHGLVRRSLGFQHVVAVIGHQRRQVQLPADFEQPIARALFDVQPMVHQLQEEVVLAIDVLPHRRSLEGLVELAEAQAGLHIAGWAAGRGDDAIGMLGDELCIHARPLAQLAFVGGERRQGEQVAQPGRVFRDHRLVQIRARGGDIVALLVRGAPQHTLFIKARFRGHVGLDADDGFDPGAGHALVKGVGSIHIAVVCHAHGGHVLLDHLISQHIDLGHAVQHGELGMVMQVDEGGVFGHAVILAGRSR